jgi:hypothetical protein
MAKKSKKVWRKSEPLMEYEKQIQQEFGTHVANTHIVYHRDTDYDGWNDYYAYVG